MPVAQYEWKGATYAVRPPKTRDELDIEALAVALGGGRGGRFWTHALNYARFAVLTSVVAGTSPIPMPSQDAPSAEQRSAMEQWLDAEGHLDLWRDARRRSEIFTPEEEQPNLPNDSMTRSSESDAGSTSSALTTFFETSPDPLLD